MKNLRKTKIICTLGPATDKEDVLRQLMLEGMNVARFNFSHGTHEEQGERLRRVCQLREELNLPVATLLDTKGPEIRLCEIEGGRAQLVEGQRFVLTTEEILGNAERVSITYQDLVKDVEPGNRILIDDGLIELRVEEVTDTEIACHVLNGGMISNKKGVNVPNVELSMPYISEKDYEDIVFGIENDYDFVAASFVRTADDVLQIRRIFEEEKINFQTAELGRVDLGGGGTIAYILALYGMNVIDSGVAVLNMHAPWEATSKADVYETKRGYEAFLRGAGM